jgi:hypothetical protein
VVKALSGHSFKLTDPKDGAYLGVLIVPESVAEYLGNHYQAMCQRYSRFPSIFEGPTNYDVISAGQFWLTKAYGLEGAVNVHQITPEEISLEPGFAFLPSAEYLRRVAAEQKIEDTKPVPAGRHLNAAREVAG